MSRLGKKDRLEYVPARPAAGLCGQQQAARYLTHQHGADYLFGLKGNQEGILERAQVKLPQDFFPCEYDTGWSKEHRRLQRWCLQRKETTPEQAGLCGCWQFIAVWRDRHYLRKGKVIKSPAWPAPRVPWVGRDASRINGRASAQVMAALRNLVLGLFELQKLGGITDGCVPGWQRKMRGSNALTLIKAKN